MSSHTSVLIADDHPLLRNGLRQVIERERDMRVVAEAGDGESALQQMAALKPDVVVLDIGMPGVNGFAVLRAMRTLAPQTAAIILTLHADEQTLFDAIDLGASGYILKDSAADAIVAGIRAVAAGGQYLSPSLAPLLMRRRIREQKLVGQLPGLADLTPTERRILHLIAAGHSSKSIANTLFVHFRTVENHRVNIAQKLGLHGSNAVLKFALEHKAEL
jgi:DNA-binding NarL/FixJ family response regulator